MDGQTLKIIHALLREQALLGVFRHADRDAEPARDIRRALVMVRMMMGQEHLVDAEAIDQAAQPVHLLVIGRRWIDEDAMRLRVTERSEEHTSELQSLMRISYAVFCLKK